jgi:hypothetical protein
MSRINMPPGHPGRHAEAGIPHASEDRATDRHRTRAVERISLDDPQGPHLREYRNAVMSDLHQYGGNRREWCEHGTAPGDRARLAVSHPDALRRRSS